MTTESSVYTLSDEAGFARLPKWAQNDIRVMEMRLREMHEALKQDRAPVTEETRIVVDQFRDYPRALDSRSRVRYTLPNIGVIETRLGTIHAWDKDKVAYVKVPCVEVAYEGKISSGLAIHPIASNVIAITGGR